MFSVNPYLQHLRHLTLKIFSISIYQTHFTDVQTEAREGEMVIQQFNFTGSSRTQEWRVGSPKVGMA